MLSSALRDYPTDDSTPQWYKKLLYWNAWAHYQIGGDNRLPDQNEFWADGNRRPAAHRLPLVDPPHHPRRHQLHDDRGRDGPAARAATRRSSSSPIDIGWDHFTVNNIRYRDRDLTVIVGRAGRRHRPLRRLVPEGYSVFLDGELAFTVDASRTSSTTPPPARSRWRETPR